MACPDCFSGFERTDAKPAGTETTVFGLPTYVAKAAGGSDNTTAAAPKGIIVIIADLFGWQFVNNRLLADTYAAAGYRVYVPDFMAGRAAKPWLLDTLQTLLTPSKTWSEAVVSKSPAVFWALVGASSALWFNWPSASFPRVRSFFEQLRAEQASQADSGGGGAGGLKIGVAGFCWGGKHTVTLTHKENSHLIDAAFTAHPSFLSLPADMDRVRKPLAIALGSKDNLLSVEQVQHAEKALLKLANQFPDQLKGKTEVRIYEGAGHGFSSRIDRRNDKQVDQARECEAQAIAWFDRLLVV
ncbi:hypothetical protein DV735_g132, partial [Chaetothyriales sp. CBS 134920]